MTNQKLIDNGYVRFAPSPIDNHCITDLFQKRFDDDIGKKYFITVRRWDMSRYNDALHTYTASYEYDVQLYQKETHRAVNLEFFNDWKLEDVEEYVEWMFSSGRFDYYEEWD